jgi:hypothetical protein
LERINGSLEINYCSDQTSKIHPIFTQYYFNTIYFSEPLLLTLFRPSEDEYSRLLKMNTLDLVDLVKSSAEVKLTYVKQTVCWTLINYYSLFLKAKWVSHYEMNILINCHCHEIFNFWESLGSTLVSGSIFLSFKMTI